jgi:ATP/maltotriose-dependent transcriptional regulator MalT
MQASPERAMKYIDDAFRAATGDGRPEYVGMLQGHQAWLAMRRRDLADAERHARSALATWQESAMHYPFQWAALLPLLAVRTSAGDLAGAADCARRLLDVHQQRLPEPLETALVELVEAQAAGADGRALDAARRAIEAAEARGFLQSHDAGTLTLTPQRADVA